MANVFPENTSGYNFGSHVQFFVDPACTIAAPITDPTTGMALPKSQVAVVGGVISSFAAGTATVLYARNNSGVTQTFYPSAVRTKPTVTGSKSANAALTSLVTALAAQGIISDTTS